MASFSNIVLMGNLTADPDRRTTPNGQELASFNVAVNTRMGNGRDDVTTFYRCTVWGKRSEVIAKYFSKGQPILVSGVPTLRRYTDKEGNERQSLEVNVNDFSFVGNRNDNSGNGGSNSYNAAPAAPAAPVDGDASKSTEPINLDDIPF